jgi:uncharacterized protein YgfB (UPF0149 family)
MNDLDAIYSWENWRDFLFRLGAIASPAELQGFAIGLIAGGDVLEGPKWLSLAEEFMDLPEPLTDLENKSAISAYSLLAQRSLADSDLSFKLMLPDDAVSMALRAEALGAWSQGFLTGFGLSGCDSSTLDEDGIDMLASLAEVAQIDAELETNEENERLFTDLCEFVRVAALYLFQHNQRAVKGPLVAPASSVH